MNNETIGQSCEYAICKIFNINCEINESRINSEVVNSVVIEFNKVKDNLPIITESIGYKNLYKDFETTEGSLSLKSLKKYNGKICPQTIGQPTLKKWDKIWGNEFNGDIKYNEQRFNYIKSNIHMYLNAMLYNTYCCDHLIIISNVEKTPKIEYYKKPSNINYFTNEPLIFTRDVYEERWNEKKQKYNEFATTIKMGAIIIGEFQFHKNSRQELKFRFFKSFLSTL